MKTRFGYTQFGKGVLINIRIDWFKGKEIFSLLEEHNHNLLKDFLDFKDEWGEKLLLNIYEVPVKKIDLNHNLDYMGEKKVLKIEGYLSNNEFDKFHSNFQRIKPLLKLYKAYKELYEFQNSLKYKLAV